MINALYIKSIFVLQHTASMKYFLQILQRGGQTQPSMKHFSFFMMALSVHFLSIIHKISFLDHL